MERKLENMTKEEIMSALRDGFDFIPPEIRDAMIRNTIVGMVQ